jgi:hypothetical protein
MCVHPPICVGAGLPANTMAAATVNGGWRLASRPGPFAGEPAPTRRPAPNHQCVSTPNLCRSGFTREYGSGGDGERRGELASRPGPFGVNPLLHDGLRPITNVCPPPICVGAGLPANTVAAATVNDGGELASRPGPFAGEPAPTRRPAPNHQCVPTTNLCRSGFTREYDGGGDGEWRVEIGLHPPFRKLNRHWNDGSAPPRLLPQ